VKTLGIFVAIGAGVAAVVLSWGHADFACSANTPCTLTSGPRLLEALAAVVLFAIVGTLLLARRGFGQTALVGVVTVVLYLLWIVAYVGERQGDGLFGLDDPQRNLICAWADHVPRRLITE
jgi:hypothetical protein